MALGFLLKWFCEKSVQFCEYLVIQLSDNLFNWASSAHGHTKIGLNHGTENSLENYMFLDENGALYEELFKERSRCNLH